MGKLEELDNLVTSNIDDLMKKLEEKLAGKKDPQEVKSKIDELTKKIEEKEDKAKEILGETEKKE